MSLSRWLRAAWVAVPAALICGGAVAQQIVTVPSGMVVILTPGQMPLLANTAKAPVLVETAQAPSALPIERIFAEQQAMMDRMMANMNALFAPMEIPSEANPGGLINAMMRQFGSPLQGVVPAAGGTFCEESVAVSYNGQTAPVVKVSRAGSGCGPATAGAPVPAEAAPAPAHHPNVIQINSPDLVTTPRIGHHT